MGYFIAAKTKNPKNKNKTRITKRMKTMENHANIYLQNYNKFK
jgi:hypothetical protein